ncbi:MAG: hypothetical protein HY481_00220 [Candidatus Vogelbacteria bacterium]|nr:hypothetical protein [Candidatus Vogelbacteria bacterium]
MAKQRKKKRWTSETKQKILLLLASGVALSLTRSPRQYFRIVKAVAREWKFINRGRLFRLVKEFKNERLVDYREKADGEIEITITDKGQLAMLNFNLDKMFIPEPKIWDQKWRLVVFDIPEKIKRARDALREKLRELGFYEWQKSVFIHPYDCTREIDFLSEFFNIRPYVRLAIIEQTTNEAELLIKFNLHKKLT